MSKVCSCGGGRQIVSFTPARCEVCGLPFLTQEETAIGNEIIADATETRLVEAGLLRSAASFHVDGMSHLDEDEPSASGEIVASADEEVQRQSEEGEDRSAAEKEQRRITRRDLYIIFLTAVGTKIVGSLWDHGKRHLGISEDEEKRDEISKDLARSLNSADVSYAQAALNKGLNLRDLAVDDLGAGQIARGQLLMTLHEHTDGVNPWAAERKLAAFAGEDHDERVKAFLLERLGKVQGLLGKIGPAIKNLQLARGISGGNEQDQARLLRQLLNHAYLGVHLADLPFPERWDEFNALLSQAQDLMGVDKEIDGWANRSRRAKKFDVGHGILMFEAISVAARSGDDVKRRRNALEAHLNFIRLFQSHDQVNGWNRYTPLAAQALYLGELEFAEAVLDEAQAKTLGDPPENEHAARVKKFHGHEWLWHLIVKAALLIKRAKRLSRSDPTRSEFMGRARELLSVPLSKYKDPDALPYLGRVNLYYRQTIPAHETAIRAELTVKGNQPPSETHSAYLPTAREE